MPAGSLTPGGPARKLVVRLPSAVASRRVKGERYQDFVFNPADLSEEGDLDLPRRKEILYTEAHLDVWTHYELLELPWNAPAEAARAAYLEKAKAFHPDRYAGQRLGSYRHRLDRIFGRLTEARDTLCDDRRREAYARSTARAAQLAVLEARRIDDERRAVERRTRLARTNPLVARATRAAELLKRGRAALDAGRFAEATNDLLAASSLDPNNGELKGLADRAKRGAAAERARHAYERAVAAHAVGNETAALAAFLEAAAADPSDPRYSASAARGALRSGELQQARSLAEAATRAAPRSAAAHEVLGEVLAALGETRDARRALERALALDATLESARDRLKKLRWSFLG